MISLLRVHFRLFTGVRIKNYTLSSTIIWSEMAATQLLQSITLTLLVYIALSYLVKLLFNNLACQCSPLHITTEPFLIVLNSCIADFIVLSFHTQLLPWVIFMRAFTDKVQVELLSAIAIKENSLIALRNLTYHIELLLVRYLRLIMH